LNNVLYLVRNLPILIAMKKIVLLFTGICFLALMSTAQTGGVSVNETGNDPDPSAIFDASSTNKGALLPRMTTAQRNAIANPAEGLQVYNTTTKCLNIWIGSAWKQLCGECEFNAPVPTANGPILAGGTIELWAATLPGATYQWSGPNGFTSTDQNPVIMGAPAEAEGMYYVSTTLDGCTPPAQGVLVDFLSSPIVFNATGTGATGTLQYFTVPAGITTLNVLAYGAGGGDWSGTGWAGLTGGLGARIGGSFSVNPGDQLKILIGQKGINGGGGGGTFVTYMDNTIIMIAGGGGGASGDVSQGESGNGGNANLGPEGMASASGATGGTDGGGGGGGTGYGAGGGGGYCGSGGDAAVGYFINGVGGQGCVNGTAGEGEQVIGSGGMNYLSGGYGGTADGSGGFGGGGGVKTGNVCGGGGGGYSGGGGGGVVTGHGRGGGGGSYPCTSCWAQVVGPAVEIGDGSVVISW
jgi:hypothetical protein